MFLFISPVNFLTVFLNLGVLILLSSFYILYINFSSEEQTKRNFFFQSEGGLFSLQMDSFAVHKPLSLMQTHLFLLAAISCAFDVI